MKIKDLLSALPEFYQFLPKPPRLSLSNDLSNKLFSKSPQTRDLMKFFVPENKVSDRINWSFRKKLWTLDELNQDVQQVRRNSAQVSEGDIFVAIHGLRHDGHSDIQNVVDRKPAAIVYQHEVAALKNFSGIKLKVPDTQKAFALLHARQQGDPSLKMWTLGVTGTNGKTTCTYLAEHLLNSVGITCGVLGTIDHHLQNSVWETHMTTPDADILQQRLAEMKNFGAKSAALEVSSHALKQKRISGIHFNTVLFTNLTRDHLDYHPSMSDYFHSKELLTTESIWESKKFPLFAIVNRDDFYGRRLKISSRAYVWTYGTDPKADFYYQIKESDLTGSHFELRTPFGFEKDLSLEMVGSHNVSNAVGVIACLTTLGLDLKILKDRLLRFPGVPGRLQIVPNNKGLFVFIDYAHTPDGLDCVLSALKKNKPASSSLRVVFGCGGDRDHGKRPLMAQSAQKWADYILVTSDNPRSEDPQKIILEIQRGFDLAKEKTSFQVDRFNAIQKILLEAKSGDTILIAGKGHEAFQQIGCEKFPFSDFQVAKSILDGKDLTPCEL